MLKCVKNDKTSQIKTKKKKKFKLHFGSNKFSQVKIMDRRKIILTFNCGFGYGCEYLFVYFILLYLFIYFEKCESLIMNVGINMNL